jgi:hypothetical protein
MHRFGNKGEIKREKNTNRTKEEEIRKKVRNVK